LFILSGASGTGKTSLVRRLVHELDDFMLSVSCTTRAQRPGECDGRDYFFLDQATFGRMVAEGAFLEHAKVFGEYYGTPRPWVGEQLAAGSDVALEIEWRGARMVRRQLEATVPIFLLPPDLPTLRSRLLKRSQDSPETIRRRVAAALDDLSHHDGYDDIVVNEDFEQALADVDDVGRCVRAGRACPGSGARRHARKLVADARQFRYT